MLNEYKDWWSLVRKCCGIFAYVLTIFHSPGQWCLWEPQPALLVCLASTRQGKKDLVLKKLWLCRLIGLRLPDGLVQALTCVLLPWKLSQGWTVPRQCLLKELKDIYYPAGARNDGQGKQQTDQKAWERGGWRGRSRALKVFPTYQGVWSTVHTPKVQCMCQKDLSGASSWSLGSVQAGES